MSTPKSPIITFQVCLEPIDTLGMNPFRYQSNGDRDVTEQANIKNTRSWNDGIKYTGKALKHGERFTLYGLEAQRAKLLYVNETGAPTCNQPLIVVSSSAINTENICVPNGEVNGPGGASTSSNNTLGSAALKQATNCSENVTGEVMVSTSSNNSLLAFSDIILDARVPTSMADITQATPTSSEEILWWGHRPQAPIGWAEPQNIRNYSSPDFSNSTPPVAPATNPMYFSSGLGTGPRVLIDNPLDLLMSIDVKFVSPEVIAPPPGNPFFGTRDPFKRPSSWTLVMVVGKFSFTDTANYSFFRATDPSDPLNATEWSLIFTTNGKIISSVNQGAFNSGGGVPTGGSAANLVAFTHDGNTNVSRLFVNGSQVGSLNVPILNIDPTTSSCASILSLSPDATVSISGNEISWGFVSILGGKVLTQSEIISYAQGEGLDTTWGITL